MKENTAKNFVIQLGALIALYVSLSALIILVFGVINIQFPDEAAYAWQTESVREGMRVSIAVLIIFFPTYLILTRVNNQTRRKEESGLYTGLAKWLIYLSLLVGGGVILGDMVIILNFLLNGEITARFLLKALALLVIVSFAFSYYLLDVRGYFKNREKKSVFFGIGALTLVFVALFFGFTQIETPAEVREMRLDQKQISNLQDMQWRVEDYYRTNQALPENIDLLYISDRVPEAPANRESYQYNIVDEKSYELCATFAYPSSPKRKYRPVTDSLSQNNYNWEHDEGEKCFERTINTEPSKVFPVELRF